MSASSSVAVPRVLNVTKVKATLRQPTLLHFTPRQWRQAISKARRSDTLELANAALVAVPTLEGGMIVFQRQGPDGTRLVLEFTKGKPSTKNSTDGYDRIEPKEPPWPTIPRQPEHVEGDPLGGLEESGPCRLVIRLTGNGNARLPTLVCEKARFGGTCALVWRRQENGTTLLACELRVP